MLEAMDDAAVFAEWLVGQGTHGVLTLDDVRDAGLTREQVLPLIRNGHLVRLLDGALTTRARWEACRTPEREHALRATALTRLLDHDVAISHVSAAAVHGLPLLGQPGRRIHVCLTGAGRGRSRVSYTLHQAYPALAPGTVSPAGPHEGLRDGPPCSPAWLHLGDGPRVVTPALAALGVAELQGFVAGVVALDGALHTGAATLMECQQLLTAMERRPGIRGMNRAVRAADAKAESALESQARLVVEALGFRVTLQVRLRTEDGEFVARVDMLIEELGVVIEVDGRVKYVNPDGSGSVEAVLSEKHRESAIRDLGYGVVRLDHPGLTQPERVRARILAAAQQAAPSRRRRPSA